MDHKLMDTEHTDGCSFASQRSHSVFCKEGGLMKEQQRPHAHSEQRLASVSFNMDVCSGFMAAVVTGRYKTSGHLTSLGDQSGGGGRSSES